MFFVFFLAVAIYFVPTIVAATRSHINFAGIIALNLLLGWTFVGWVVALVWSLSAQPADRHRPAHHDPLTYNVKPVDPR